MSWTETARATRARRRPWAEVVYLLELTLTRDPFGAAPASLVLRLADRPYRYPESGAPTEQWLPYVVDWGTVQDAIDPSGDGGIQVAAFDVTLDNARPIAGVARFSDLLRADRSLGTGYDFAFSSARLVQVFKGLDTADRAQLFRLVVEEPSAITDETLVLRMSGPELVLEDYDRLPRITTEQFPLAAPAAVGQAIPLLLGTCRNVPLQFITAGIVDKLREAITTTVPPNGGILRLSTPDKVARLPDAGVVQFQITAASTGNSTGDGSGAVSVVSLPAPAQQTARVECVSYSGRDIDNAALLNVQRAQRGTAPGDADAGVDVFEVLEEYVGVAGVNLGPLAVSALASVYCDGMYKASETEPRHTIELTNTTDWPPYSLTLVRFQATASGDLTPWASAVEMAELATLTDDCYPHGTAGSYGTGQFRTPQGVSVMRLGVDHPCGSKFNYWEVWFRFNIADKPDPAGDTVYLRLFNGVNAGQTALGIGEIDLLYTPSYLGPLVPSGAGGGAMTVGRQGVAGNAPSGNGVDGITPITSLGVVLAPGLYSDAYFYMDVSAAYAAAKAAGNPSLTCCLRLKQVEQVNIGAGRIVTRLDGTQDWPAYTNRWYGIADLENPALQPALFLGAAQQAGALLTRPNGGTSSASAAEACLGQVTVDVSGPLDFFNPTIDTVVTHEQDFSSPGSGTWTATITTGAAAGMVFVVLGMGSYGPSFTGSITSATIDGGGGPVALTLLFLETVAAYRKLWFYYYPSALALTTYTVNVAFTGNVVVPGALIAVNYATSLGAVQSTHTGPPGTGIRSVTLDTLGHQALILGCALNQTGTITSPTAGQSVLIQDYGTPGASGHMLIYADQLAAMGSAVVVSITDLVAGSPSGGGDTLYGAVPIFG